MAHTLAVDSSNRIFSLVKRVDTHFAHSGIERSSEFQHADSVSRRERPIQHLRLLATRKTQGKAAFIGKHGRIVTRQVNISFDIRGLDQKYINEIWAKDVPLEKLSLYRAGRKAIFAGKNNERVVDEEYEEIASIPLPTEESQ